jgi:hypothetical protein
MHFEMLAIVQLCILGQLERQCWLSKHLEVLVIVELCVLAQLERQC